MVNVNPHNLNPIANPVFAHRIEEASMNAWPAMQQTLLDGWVLRFSKGFTKRSNSIAPLYPPHDSLTDSQVIEKIRYCENLYAREQLQTVFRMTSIPAESSRLDNLLEDRGYKEIERCHVLICELADSSHAEISLTTLEQWLHSYCHLTGIGEPASTLHQLILKGIAGDCAFAVLNDSACGLGVVEHELIGLFDIFTHPERRRSGFGRKIVQGILDWGYAHGARRAYLQVVSDNTAALRLYDQLGFTISHDYWYRIAP